MTVGREHPFGEEAALLGVCETCGAKPCVCKQRLADALREYPTWSDAYLAVKAELEQAEREQAQAEQVLKETAVRLGQAERERDALAETVRHYAKFADGNIARAALTALEQK